MQPVFNKFASRRLLDVSVLACVQEVLGRNKKQQPNMSAGNGRRLKTCYSQRVLQKIVFFCGRSRLKMVTWLGVVTAVIVTVTCLFITLTLDSRSILEVKRLDETPAQAPTFQQMARLVELFLSKPTRGNTSVINKQSFESEVANFKSSSSLFDDLLCQKERVFENDVSAPKTSLVFSLYNIPSMAEALVYIRQHFLHVPANFTDDVIITADVLLSQDSKDLIEDALDPCSFCRLFFFTGSIYQHWNMAAKFAHHEYIIFTDARVTPTSNWLPSLLKTLKGGNVVSSPQLRLIYPDNGGHNVGLSRNEVTWDLKVVRVAVNDRMVDEARTLGHTYINQTIISREVFGVRKEFFLNIDGFDIFPDATGGEHVSFSLKVLNCKGNIVTSLCSNVFLRTSNPLVNSSTVTTNYQKRESEFHNPTFHVTYNNASLYYVASSKVLLDLFSSRYYTCALGTNMDISEYLQTKLSPSKKDRRIASRSDALPKDTLQYLKSRYVRYGTNLKQKLIKRTCDVMNLRYILAQRQPATLPPTKLCTFYGYIRTIDGMYAFGMRANSTDNSDSSSLHSTNPKTHTLLDLAPGHFILTRNTSLWVGPFSFTKGAFIYRNVWCLTRDSKGNLSLTKCVKANASQLFGYTEGVITPLGVANLCACARQPEDVSMEILMARCDDRNVLKHFKLDVQFTEACIKS